MAVQFKPGNNVVYPVYGVARIESLETKKIADKKHTFYILKTLKNDITVMVPVENTSKVGMRKIISKRRVPEVFEVLKRKKTQSPTSKKQAWNKRHKEYSEKIKNGDIFEVAEVFRDIFKTSKKKDLSFGEKQIMENAFSLVSSEIAVATSKSEEGVGKEIHEAVSK